MNKTLARLLVALLLIALLAPCALAENAADALLPETIPFTAEDGSFSFSAPGDWYEMNTETIMSIIQGAVENGEMDEVGVNDAAQQLLAQIEGFAAYFYAPDFMGNLNVTVEDNIGLEISDATLGLVKSSLEQQAAAVGMTIISVELKNMYGRDCFESKVEYLGADMTQYMLVNGGNLYTFTFAASAQDGIDTVMSTLAFNE